jgi:hypothetical protein
VLQSGVKRREKKGGQRASTACTTLHVTSR